MFEIFETKLNKKFSCESFKMWIMRETNGRGLTSKIIFLFRTNFNYNTITTDHFVQYFQTIFKFIRSKITSSIVHKL